MSAVQTTPAAVEPLTAAAILKDLPSTFTTDGSTVSDPKAYAAAFEQLTDGLVSHAAAMTAAGEASKMGALASLALREVCLRKDNGAPDWSGTVTDAYKTGFGTYLTQYGHSHGLTDAAIDKYRSAVRSYASDHQLVDRAMALWTAKTSTKATADTAAVVAAFDAKAGTKLPAAVVKNIRAARATQVRKDGARLPNMDDASAASVSGRRPKADQTRVQSGNASEESPGKQWEKVREQVQAGKLPPATLAEEVHHVLSLAVLALVGPIGEKVTPATKLPGGGAGRKQAVDTYTECGRLLAALAKLDAKQGTKDALAEHLWSDQDSK